MKYVSRIFKRVRRASIVKLYNIYVGWQQIHELQYEKIFLWTYAPREDPDQGAETGFHYRLGLTVHAITVNSKEID